MNIWIINHYIDVPGKGRYLRHYNFAKELQKEDIMLLYLQHLQHMEQI